MFYSAKFHHIGQSIVEISQFFKGLNCFPKHLGCNADVLAFWLVLKCFETLSLYRKLCIHNFYL